MGKILKLIMKYPLQFLLSALAVTIPFTIAIVVLRYNIAIGLGVYGIVILGIVFASLNIALWWALAFIICTNLFYRFEKGSNEINYNEFVKRWEFNILIGSFACLFWGVITLLVCYWLKFSFKWFILLSFTLIIVRFIIAGIEIIRNNTKPIKALQNFLNEHH